MVYFQGYGLFLDVDSDKNIDHGSGQILCGWHTPPQCAQQAGTLCSVWDLAGISPALLILAFLQFLGSYLVEFVPSFLSYQGLGILT